MDCILRVHRLNSSNLFCSNTVSELKKIIWACGWNHSTDETRSKELEKTTRQKWGYGSLVGRNIATIAITLKTETSLPLLCHWRALLFNSAQTWARGHSNISFCIGDITTSEGYLRVFIILPLRTFWGIKILPLRHDLRRRNYWNSALWTFLVCAEGCAWVSNGSVNHFYYSNLSFRVGFYCLFLRRPICLVRIYILMTS